MQLCESCFPIIVGALADVLTTGTVTERPAPADHAPLTLGPEFRLLGQLAAVIAAGGMPHLNPNLADTDHQLAQLYMTQTPPETLGLCVTLDHLIEALALIRVTAERMILQAGNLTPNEREQLLAVRRDALITQIQRMIGMAGGETEVVEVARPNRAPGRATPNPVLH